MKTAASSLIVEVPVQALVGRKEAADMLGVYPENIGRITGLPRPLQDRGIRGFAVTTGPLWPRAEIEALARLEAARRRREKLPSLAATRRALAEAKARSPREQARAAKTHRGSIRKTAAGA